MESKQQIQILTSLAGKMEKVQSDVEQIKLDLARNERVSALENKMAAMEVKIWVLVGSLGVLASGIVGFYFNHNG